MSLTASALNGDQSFNLDQIMQQASNARLLKSLTNFAHAMSLNGYTIAIHSPNSLQKLPLIPDAKKKAIADYFDTWATWITPVASKPEFEIDHQREIGYAKRALEHYGMRASDEFWKTITGNEVIEVYDHEGIQLYRSLSFFKYCGYSLLDISVNEWFVLWERPRRVVEEMIQITQSVLKHTVALQKSPLPKHAVREILSTGMTNFFKPRAFLQDFLYIGSLNRNPLAPPCGAICTSHVELIAEGDEAYDIQFV